MRKLSLALVLFLSIVPAFAQAREDKPRVLVFFSMNVEADHALFAVDALKYLLKLSDKDNFTVDATTDWNNLNDEYLKPYKLVVWLDDLPQNQAQREAFEHYMTHGGAWLGFHVAAYNDKDTKWPWFLSFIGGGVFGANTWPPVPAKIIVDDTSSPLTQGLPKQFQAPTNEWYSWNPSPRLDKNIHVLLTLDPENYPLGIKGLITDGDVPVAWTNVNYKMVYMNMGHGDKVLDSPVQNLFIENSIVWLLAQK